MGLGTSRGVYEPTNENSVLCFWFVCCRVFVSKQGNQAEIRPVSPCIEKQEEIIKKIAAGAIFSRKTRPPSFNMVLRVVLTLHVEFLKKSKIFDFSMCGGRIEVSIASRRESSLEVYLVSFIGVWECSGMFENCFQKMSFVEYVLGQYFENIWKTAGRELRFGGSHSYVPRRRVRGSRRLGEMWTYATLKRIFFQSSLRSD